MCIKGTEARLTANAGIMSLLPHTSHISSGIILGRDLLNFWPEFSLKSPKWEEKSPVKMFYQQVIKHKFLTENWKFLMNFG